MASDLNFSFARVYGKKIVGMESSAFFIQMMMNNGSSRQIPTLISYLPCFFSFLFFFFSSIK